MHDVDHLAHFTSQKDGVGEAPVIAAEKLHARQRCFWYTHMLGIMLPTRITVSSLARRLHLPF